MKKILLSLFVFLVPLLTIAEKIAPAKLETTQSYTIAMAVSFVAIILGLVIYYFVWKSQRAASLKRKINTGAKNMMAPGRKMGPLRTTVK